MPTPLKPDAVRRGISQEANSDPVYEPDAASTSTNRALRPPRRQWRAGRAVVGDDEPTGPEWLARSQHAVFLAVEVVEVARPALEQV